MGMNTETRKASKSPSNYVDQKQLALLLRRAQATGQPDPELCDIARSMGEKIALKFFFKRQADIEEAGTVGVITIMKKFRQIDPNGNPFSYLTACIRSAIRDELARAERDQTRLQKYLEKRMREKAQADEAEQEAERATDELLRRLGGV